MELNIRPWLGALQRWALLYGRSSRSSPRGLPLEPETVRERARLLRRLLADHGLDPRTVTPDEAHEFVVARRAAGWAPGYVNQNVSALLMVFRFRGVQAVLPRFKEPASRLQALSLDLASVVRSYSHPDPATSALRRFLVALRLHTGAEPSEVVAMEVEDVDEDRLRLHILHPCKGHDARTLPAPRWLVTSDRHPSFRTWMRHRLSPPRDPRALFTARTRGQVHRLHPGTITNIDAEISRETGVRFNSRIARHTVATRMTEAGYPPKFIAYWLGVTLQTVEVYGEANPDTVDRMWRQKSKNRKQD